SAGNPRFTRQWARFDVRFGPVDALIHGLTSHSAVDFRTRRKLGTRRRLERPECDKGHVNGFASLWRRRVTDFRGLLQGGHRLARGPVAIAATEHQGLGTIWRGGS